MFQLLSKYKGYTGLQLEPPQLQNYNYEMSVAFEELGQRKRRNQENKTLRTKKAGRTQKKSYQEGTKLVRRKNIAKK